MYGGGIADKVGNRFEALWLTRHLVELIDGRAESVLIEPLAPDAGFEFCFTRSTHREWHQCKRQSSGGWTVGRLAREGILTNFRAKLADGLDRCVFVSTDPSKPLKLLKEKLPAAADPEQFEQHLSADGRD